jgi:hypothetical protein
MNVALDGTNQETFNKSMDGLLGYLLSLSEQKTNGKPVRCFRCGDTRPYIDGEWYKCNKCGHDTGEIKMS